jgi:hypothetical protein
MVAFFAHLLHTPTQGGAMSPTSGNFEGQLHTVPDARVANVFALRSVERAGTTETGVVGVALPRSVVQSLRSKQLLSLGPIQTLPPGASAGSQQWVFQPGAIETVQKHGFFFSSDSGERADDLVWELSS